jgi:ribosomal protein S27AE
MNAAQKSYARKRTRLAVQAGKLERPEECSKCGGADVQAHHRDYAKPLEVEWLCGDCHRSAHAGERRGRGRPPMPARSGQEIAELREVEERYQQAYRRSEELREERNAAVRAAIEAGWTHAQIAEATGLTRTRVGQIALQR